jgi:transposase
MNPNTLLADPESLEILKFVSQNNLIEIVIRSILPSADCPNCHQSSSSLKTHYSRSVADLAWHGVAVRLLLKVRKFRCRNELCLRKVFCERLPKVVAKYARRTVRLNEVISFLTYALGGRGSVKVTPKLNISISKDTLIRLIRRQTKTIPAEVRVLGVDDFAFRKGLNYGTILVDLEKRRPIDLLPDRQLETLKNWLLGHPQIEVVTRDRSISYAEGISNALPNAAQVADRWHLLKNLSELLEKILMGELSSIKQAFQATFQTQNVRKIPEVVELKEKTDSSAEVGRREIYEKTKKLFSQGCGIRKIGRELGLNRNTVRTYLRAKEFPRRQTGQGSKTKLRKYAEYLQKRWLDGEENAERLFEEIQQQGFAGSVSAVRRFVQKWRNSLNKSIKPLSNKAYSPRRTAKMLLTKADKNEEQEYIKKLCEINPKIGKLQKLGVEFRAIIREKRAELFDEWLEKVQLSEIAELESWAKNLLIDEKAVRAAMSSKWSNGQTEGQVNRLKTIKRQMYGRAGFDLLKARVLHQN